LRGAIGHHQSMAQAPILYDFDITLSHVERGLDQRISVRTARHPSETLNRVWQRVLTYCLFWEERLVFGPGLSDPDEPDLQAFDLTSVRTLWIRVGKPDPARVQKAADQNGRARIAVVFDSPERMKAFVAEAVAAKLSRLGRVELCAIDPALTAALAETDARRAKVSVTFVGDHFYVDCGDRTLEGALTRTTLAV
jgi:uncharacterized protein YaeQ